MKRITTLLALLLPLLAGAQTMQDYEVSIENATWQSIASTGTLLNNVYSSYTETIQLPFDLEFGQHTFYQGQNIKVTGRGTLIFSNYGPYSYSHTHWNDPSNEYVIIPFFMGQSESPNRNTVYWLTRPDDRGGQELVVEWSNLRRSFHNGESVAYQVHVHSNGDIGVLFGPATLTSDEDTLFTFALVAGYTTDRVLITGNWNTSSSIAKANPSNVNHWPLTPLMSGTPAQGLYITYMRPLPPCPHPTHLTVSGVQQEEVTISWTGNGVSGCQYKIQYDTADFTPGSQASITVSDTFYNINFLSPDHHYYVYVRSDCGADTSNWEGTDFWTSCNEMTHAELPYEQHFESTAGTTCWRKLGSLNWSSQSGSGANLVRFCSMNSGDSYAIMQPMDYVGDLQVSFRVKNGPVMVGVMDSPSDTASFVPLHECWANSADWYPYTVRLSRYDGNGKYIAFRPWPNQYGVASCILDDVVLDTIQGCIAPENVTAVHVNAVSADIRWADYDSVGAYRVIWQGAGLAADTMVVSTDHCTLTGLTSELGYTVAVSILCDAATVSPADTATFTTLPTCMTPVAIAIDSITGRHATVHWTEMNNVGIYRVVLNESFGDIVRVDTVVGDTTITYRNLQAHKQYRVDVSQLCAGAWTDARWETFRTVYSCQGPQSVSADSIATTSAQIVISDTLGAGPYRAIVIGGSQSDTLIVSTPHFPLSTLLPATSYNVLVSTVCSDSTFSDAVSVRFATPCSMITHADLPYVETFDNCTNGDEGSLSPCWTYRNFAPSNYVGMYRPLASVHHGDGGLSLYTMVNSSAEPMFIALPEVDSLADVVLGLWVYCSWVGDATVDVGVMTDPTDTTTFTALHRYVPMVRNQWVEVEVPLGGHNGSYPALRAGTTSATMSDALYFDDVTLRLNLSCERPDSLIVGDLTDTSATLTIVPSADADSDAAAYHVVISSYHGSDTLILSTTNYQLSSLLPATDYGVEVRSECPEGGLTTATHTQFTTPCGAYPLPWTDDFEHQDEYRLPRCWELMDSGSSSPQVRSTWVTPYSGDKAMVVHVYDSTYASFATPWMRPYAGPVALTFMARAFSFRYMADTTELSLQVAVQNDDGVTTIFSDKVLYKDWTMLEFTAATGLLANGGRFVITVLPEADTNDRTSVLHIDDISIAATCAPVSNLTIITSDSIPTSLTAEWTPMGLETSWVVWIADYAFIYEYVVSSPYIVLTDLPQLSDSTNYWIVVRPLCGEGDTGAWSEELQFRTPDPYNPQGITASRLSAISIYPNPARNELTVAWPHGGMVELIDVSGRQTGNWKLATGRQTTIDVSHLPRGAYFMRLTYGHDVVIRKVMLR